LVDIQLQ